MKEYWIAIVFWLLCVRGFATLSEVPVTNFQMSLFGANGYKSWSVTGKEGRCGRGQEVIDIVNMRLETFSPDGKGKLESTVLSPFAKIFPQTHVASGDDFVTVSTESYTVLGKNWYYDGLAQKIRVNENVRVTFFNSIVQKHL